MKQQNRPYNVQLVSDNLAQFGIKKGQVQRAMEALADSQLLICKVRVFTQVHAAHTRIR